MAVSAEVTVGFILVLILVSAAAIGIHLKMPSTVVAKILLVENRFDAYL